MMEQSVLQMNRYFDKQILLCVQRNQNLQADERTDEAVFEKVKANIYDIFRTILSVTVKNGKGDQEAVRRFFVLKMEQIPANWAAAYEKARQHNDAVKMKMEQVKLDTVGEIKEMFEEIWEGVE